MFPLTEAGLGQVLLAGRRAATSWYDLLKESDVLAPYQRPELDIVAYLPRAESMSQLDHLSHELFLQSANAPREQQIHLATYVVKPEALRQRSFEIQEDAEQERIMRSVLMKPEQESWVGDLHTHVEALTREMMAKN